MRYNVLRDTEAKLMKKVCKDVKIEPKLLPVEINSINGNAAKNARLNISAKVVWTGYERSFFDVRVDMLSSHLGATVAKHVIDSSS